jgi:hypothetical protein
VAAFLFYGVSVEGDVLKPEAEFAPLGLIPAYTRTV